MKPSMLITGASSGVGVALTKHFSSRYLVFAAARRIGKMLELYRGNQNVVPIEADLASPEAAWVRLEAAFEEFGAPLRLINNAGIMVAGNTEEWCWEDFERSFAVNVKAPVHLMRSLIPSMRQAGYGRIINITSGAPFNCFQGYGLYSATKAALNAFTITCANENRDLDIKINLMSPGPVRSEMAPDAPMDPSVCLPTAEYLVDLDASGPSGRFFWLGWTLPAVPDLSGVAWLEGSADERFERVIP